MGCLVSDPNFGLGISRMWEKEEETKISEKKRKRHSNRIKFDLMRVVHLILLNVFSFIF